MTRFQLVNPQTATGKTKELLDAVQAKLGLTPNMMRALANAPAALEGYLQFSGALSHGVLNAKVREQLALAVAQTNTCDYCLAAHSAIGKMVGLTPEQIADSRHGSAVDARTKAILTLADVIVKKQGLLAESDLSAARSAGLDDAVIAETVANVALNIYTNYFNHVAQTEIDFPPAGKL